MQIHETNHPLRLKHREMLNLLDSPITGEMNNECMTNIYDILKITRCLDILEIGFNRGSSSLMFLLCAEDIFITSIDIVKKEKSISTLKLLFQERFNFVQMNSAELFNNEKFKDKYGLIFIDGEHSQAAIQSDTTCALSLNPMFLLYDDYTHPAHKQDFNDFVLNNPRLRLIKEYGTHCGQGLFLVFPE